MSRHPSCGTRIHPPCHSLPRRWIVCTIAGFLSGPSWRDLLFAGVCSLTTPASRSTLARTVSIAPPIRSVTVNGKFSAYASGTWTVTWDPDARCASGTAYSETVTSTNWGMGVYLNLSKMGRYHLSVQCGDFRRGGSHLLRRRNRHPVLKQVLPAGTSLDRTPSRCPRPRALPRVRRFCRRYRRSFGSHCPDLLDFKPPCARGRLAVALWARQFGTSKPARSGRKQR